MQQQDSTWSISMYANESPSNHGRYDGYGETLYYPDNNGGVDSAAATSPPCRLRFPATLPSTRDGGISKNEKSCMLDATMTTSCDDSGTSSAAATKEVSEDDDLGAAAATTAEAYGYGKDEDEGDDATTPDVFVAEAAEEEFTRTSVKRTMSRRGAIGYQGNELTKGTSQEVASLLGAMQASISSYGQSSSPSSSGGQQQQQQQQHHHYNEATSSPRKKRCRWTLERESEHVQEASDLLENVTLLDSSTSNRANNGVGGGTGHSHHSRTTAASSNHSSFMYHTTDDEDDDDEDEDGGASRASRRQRTGSVASDTSTEYSFLDSSSERSYLSNS